jgi:Ca2+-binding RTX toxin-like protein
VVSETNAAAAGGNDLVTSEIDYTLGANVENLQLAGAAITGIGNSLDNRITGTAGNNTLQGGLGNDTLDGGLGTDTASYAGGHRRGDRHPGDTWACRRTPSMPASTP